MPLIAWPSVAEPGANNQHFFPLVDGQVNPFKVDSCWALYLKVKSMNLFSFMILLYPIF